MSLRQGKIDLGFPSNFPAVYIEESALFTWSVRVRKEVSKTNEKRAADCAEAWISPKRPWHGILARHLGMISAEIT